MAAQVQSDGTINLHGKLYKTVALRVQEFREKHPIEEGWAIQTQMVHCNAESVIMRAVIIDPVGREIAVGYAEEQRTNRGINATSALENAETSAIGRALAAAGFAGTEYASADELVNALQQQNQRGQQEQRPQQGQRPNRKGRDAGGEKTRFPNGQQDPSWAQDHKPFVEALRALRLEMQTILNFAFEQGWGDPRCWTQDERASFLQDLRGGRFPALYTPPDPPQAEG